MTKFILSNITYLQFSGLQRPHRTLRDKPVRSTQQIRRNMLKL